MKKLVSAQSDQLMSRYDGRSRDEMIEMMDRALEPLSEAERLTARFEIDEYGYDYDPSTYYGLFMKYKRLETDAEFAKRQAEEELRTSDRLAREKKEYERLKKQFG